MSDSKLSDYFDTIQSIENEQIKIANLNFFDIGYKVKNKTVLSELCLRLYINGNKRPHEELGTRAVPESINGILTDVISTFPDNEELNNSENPRVKMFDPLTGGISIGPEGDTATLGVIMRSNTFGNCALTTFHGNYINDVIYQPSKLDNSDTARPICTLIDHYFPLDISIVKLNVSGYLNQILDLSNPVSVASWNRIEQLFIEKRTVTKSGRSSEVSTGYISGLDPLTKKVVIFPNDSADPLTCKGDSGAVWIAKETNEIVAVHSRGESSNQISEFAVAFALEPLMNYWNLTVNQVFA